MTAVLEKIARAMWERNRVLCSGAIELAPWENENEQLRDSWRSYARAALLALRDATDETTLNGSIVCTRLDMILAEPAS